jgi:hypothetical protein
MVSQELRLTPACGYVIFIASKSPWRLIYLGTSGRGSEDGKSTADTYLK